MAKQAKQLPPARTSKSNAATVEKGARAKKNVSEGNVSELDGTLNFSEEKTNKNSRSKVNVSDARAVDLAATSNSSAAKAGKRARGKVAGANAFELEGTSNVGVEKVQKRAKRKAKVKLAKVSLIETGVKPVSRRGSKLATLISFDQEVRQLLTSAGPINNRLPAFAMQLNLFPRKVRHLIGVDEVGRGCLAGPLVAGAVCFSAETIHAALIGDLDRLNDSKQVSAKRREELAKVIHEKTYAAVGVASVREINTLGLTRANELAMERAVDSVAAMLGADSSGICVIVDGRRLIDQFKYKQIAIVGADAKSASVAAASIIAKVRRDVLMAELSEIYPEYRWSENKGYPAPSHQKAILEHGRTPIHRIGFGEPAPVEDMDVIPLLPLFD